MRMIFSGDEMSAHSLSAGAERPAPEGITGVPGLPAARSYDPGRTNAPSFRISYLLLVLILGGPVSAQERPESPVFKDYKPPDKVSLIEPSTATYDLWQVFSLTRKANAGDPVAQHDLGVRHLLGRGVAADTVRGAYWIQKAAAQNVVPARFNLGILFYNGWGVEWNPFEAYIHFTYCASMNMDEAKYVLGQFLSDGLVVPRDYSRARRIVSEAVAAGYEPAKRMLEQIERMIEAGKFSSEEADGEPDPFIPDSLYEPVLLDMGDDSTARSRDVTLLRDVLRSGGDEVKYAFGDNGDGEFEPDSIDFGTLESSANAGSPEALVLLGRLHETGATVRKDPILAASCYLRAFRLGSTRAASLLWKQTERDDFFPLLKSRAASGEPTAQFVWATFHSLGIDPSLSRGEGGITDAQALRLMKNAAEQGSIPAMVELGNCYYVGRWLTMDRIEAIRLWEEASALGNAEGGIRSAMVTVRQPASEGGLEEAIAVLRHGASVGSVLAEVALAYCSEQGIGVPPSKGAAAALYRRAAVRGSRDAYYALQRMHDEIRPDEPQFRINEPP